MWQKGEKPKLSLLARKRGDPGRGPSKYIAVWLSGCSEFQSLSVMLDGSSGRYDQVDDLLCAVAELQEEVGQLRNLRESEGKIDCWSCTLPSLDDDQNKLRVPYTLATTQMEGT